LNTALAAARPNLFQFGMKVLIIGSGGREHALAWKIAQSPLLGSLFCAPGNAGIASEKVQRTGEPVQLVDIKADNLAALVEFAKSRHIDFTIVGPDDPLAMGVVDLFQREGLRIWGPNKKAAQFESSKAFAQNFMLRHGIPTAQSEVFSDPNAAMAFAESLGGQCAVKADGLALGKGVLITSNLQEAHAAIDEMLVKRAFGKASERIVIQEYLEGMEISLHALCDGTRAIMFPTAQDHKRALEGDRGLNTGGMGTYSPTPFLSDSELETTTSAILKPWLQGCQADGIDFRGIIYPGIMLTKSGPRVLEFNARFGDPETQVYLARMQGDLLSLLLDSAEGKLQDKTIAWAPESAVCVVMASEGYPGSYPRGKVIGGLEAAARIPGVKVFHAGTAKSDGRIVTNGGRVLGVTALGEDLATARAKALEAVDLISFEGAQWRRDIGAKAAPDACAR
jgi:phosphoribosylamine---glycine ligase